MGRMDGLRPPKSPPPPPQPARNQTESAANQKRILFVCIGNICRSPMAEAIANTYGRDVLVAQSAGVSPGMSASSLTRKILLEKNIYLGDHVPRPLDLVDMQSVDLLVNMSGYDIPPIARKMEQWEVVDPIGQPETVYRDVRDRIEGLVMNLILRIRTGRI